MAFSCLYVINLWRKAVVNVSEKWWLSGAEYIVATHLWNRRKRIRVVSLLSVAVDIELGLQKAKDMNEIFDMPLIHNAGNCQIYLFYRGSPWSQLSEISIPQFVLTSSTIIIWPSDWSKDSIIPKYCDVFTAFCLREIQFFVFRNV